MSSAERRAARHSIVARTTLIGFVEPSDLRQDVADARRLDDGAHRAAGDHAGARAAGLSITFAAPKCAMISCGIVVPPSAR